MPCKHHDVRFTVDINSRNRYSIIDISGPVGRRISSRPAHMTVDIKCEDCGYEHRYNADAADAHAGAWPVWLLNHLRVLVEVDDALRRACLACHVPGITEEANT